MQFRQKLTTIKFSATMLFFFIWVVFYLSPIIVESGNDTFNWNHIFSVWRRVNPFLILSVINHFILIPYIFFKRKWVYFLTTLIMLVAFGFTLKILQQSQQKATIARITEQQLQNQEMLNPPIPGQRRDLNRRSPEFRPQLRGQRPGDLPPFMNSIMLAILILGFDLGLSTTFKWNKLERQREAMEKERVKSELAFLRSQLSPHFFMNTLNNIHALIDVDSEEAKESIIRLSRLMRHLLYDSEKELIPLSKEVSFIQSYVDLMKMRFTEKVNVTFTVSSDFSNILVPPLLFTSLIENAFKHGVSYQHDSFIKIELSTAMKKLIFVISNSKYNTGIRPEENTSGIGLENTIKRLDLLYPSKYHMNIINTVDFYSVELKLPL
jgi:hypothetical protein